MDLKKIGQYIAAKRKGLNLTQQQLAEKLGMSDKSVSKWERGICLPDVSIYLELCKILGISLNEFIAGEDISTQNIIENSERNIIKVASDSKKRSKNSKKIIGLLLIFSLFTSAFAGYLLYKGELFKHDFVEPISKDSPEMKMAEILADVDGAFFYNYDASESYKKVSVNLSVYKRGSLIARKTIMTLPLYDISSHKGIIAIVPDFNKFKVKIIFTDAESKVSTDFPLLEDVSGKSYFGRTSSQIEESLNISKDANQGLVALIYGKKHVSSIPIKDIQSGNNSEYNDYTYLISVKFQ